jgi:hypothetical protein
MRVLVTGSRTWTGEVCKERLWRRLDEQFEAHGPLTIIHGACPRCVTSTWSAWARTCVWRSSPTTPPAPRAV